LKIQGENIDK